MKLLRLTDTTIRSCPEGGHGGDCETLYCRCACHAGKLRTWWMVKMMARRARPWHRVKRVVEGVILFFLAWAATRIILMTGHERAIAFAVGAPCTLIVLALIYVIRHPDESACPCEHHHANVTGQCMNRECRCPRKVYR